jgi:hypothetical protein
VALLPCAACILATPSRYINIEYTVKYKAECLKKAREQVMQHSKLAYNPPKELVSQQSMTEREPTFKKNLENLQTNKEFISICLGLTGLFFVVTGVQYWLP